jgi:hypothetical protein
VIYEMVQNLSDLLSARGYPVPVLYGPERMIRHAFDPAIIFERDREGTDEIRAVQGQQANARRKAVRDLAVRATIYAKSNVDGAHIGDHERACEALVDAVIVALYDWAVEAKAGAINYTEARYLSAADLDEIETFPGVVYALRFRVPRGVFALTYSGDARPTGSPTAVSNQTQARISGREDEDPAIGCGA